MTDAFAAIDAQEDLDPLVHPSARERKKPDRLPPMLFLAALVHGILIIGVTFNAMLGSGASDTISLEVTIVADPGRSIAEPEDADYLAQANQEGSGNTLLHVRPGALPASNVPFDNAGDADGTSLDHAQAEQESADQVLSTASDTDTVVADLPREEPMPEESTALALEAGAETTLPLPQENEVRLQIHDDNPRELVTSVDTRESIVAGYLDRWKRKIEITGVRYFPEQSVLRELTGSPTLEVTINASGQLDEVIVTRSSGSTLLDQAALNILRRASPFDPFPETIRVEYDRLRFAYKWQFSGTGTPAAANAN
ncbi:MAG TPA: TonB family protein [Woeseiaceae bacterium]|nr:TonB family protein [Woeseiaceae bacterium]